MADDDCFDWWRERAAKTCSRLIGLSTSRPLTVEQLARISDMQGIGQAERSIKGCRAQVTSTCLKLRNVDHMHVGTFGQLRLRQSTFQSQVSKIHTVLTFCSREHDCSFRLMYMRRTIPCRIPRSRGDSHFVSTVCILRMESAGSNLMVLVTSTVQLSRGSSFREGNAARLSGRGCGGGLAACGLGRVAHLSFPFVRFVVDSYYTHS